MTGCGLWMNYDELKGNSIYTIGIYWDILGILGILGCIDIYFTLFYSISHFTLLYILIQFDTS